MQRSTARSRASAAAARARTIADMVSRMPAKMLRMIAVAAVCVCDGALTVAAAGQPRHTQASVQGPAASSQSMDRLKATGRAKQNVVRTPGDRGAYVDLAAPYKANRLSSQRASEPILNVPGQTTVLT